MPTSDSTGHGQSRPGQQVAAVAISSPQESREEGGDKGEREMGEENSEPDGSGSAGWVEPNPLMGWSHLSVIGHIGPLTIVQITENSRKLIKIIKSC